MIAQLEAGTYGEWFGAVSTFLAVCVALFQRRADGRKAQRDRTRLLNSTMNDPRFDLQPNCAPGEAVYSPPSRVLRWVWTLSNRSTSDSFHFVRVLAYNHSERRYVWSFNAYDHATRHVGHVGPGETKEVMYVQRIPDNQPDDWRSGTPSFRLEFQDSDGREWQRYLPMGEVHRVTTPLSDRIVSWRRRRAAARSRPLRHWTPD